VPMYRNYVSTAREAEAKSNLETIRLLEEQYFADHRSYIDAATTDLLKAALPGFEPGDSAKLYYNYKVEANPGSTNNIADSFLATATPKAGGTAFTIDEANNKSW